MIIDKMTGKKKSVDKVAVCKMPVYKKTVAK